MAKQKSSTSVQPDSLVNAVVGDPGAPQSSVFVRGFAGQAAAKGYSRLYLDMQFSSYVDIDNDDILAVASSDSGALPLSMTYVWVAGGANLRWNQMGTRSRLYPVPTGPGGCSITEAGCPVSTTHIDCPTPSANLVCPHTEQGCAPTEWGCPPPETENCETAGCPPETDDCYYAPRPRQRARKPQRRPQSRKG